MSPDARIGKRLHFLPVSVYFYLYNTSERITYLVFGVEDWTQGLMVTRKVPGHWATFPFQENSFVLKSVSLGGEVLTIHVAKTDIKLQDFLCMCYVPLKSQEDAWWPMTITCKPTNSFPILFCTFWQCCVSWIHVYILSADNSCSAKLSSLLGSQN